ncbi:MAG: hypothetical protein ACO331_16210 [Prochlorothrix sp.]
MIKAPPLSEGAFFMGLKEASPRAQLQAEGLRYQALRSQAVPQP